MAADEVEKLPEDLRAWIARRADELGVDPEEVIRRTVAVHRAVDRVEKGSETDGVEGLVDRLDNLDERVDDLESADSGVSNGRIADLETRMESLSADLDEKVADVRERVVQVKRETDAKAAADHDHENLRKRVERAASAVEDVEERTEAVEDRLDDGFADFREVLEHLTETSEEMEGRTETLARVAVDLRDRVADLETDRTAREAADELRRAANRNGDATAGCEDCGRTIRIGLLSRPRCPHCDAAFADLDPSGRFFGSATLRTGRPPALEGGSDPVDAPTDLFSGDGDD